MSTGYHVKEEVPGIVYAFFLFGVYILGIGGGYLADNWLGYTKSCLIGCVLMVFGYAMIAIPNHSLPFLCTALGIVVVGNGFYKSNLVALLGNLYERPDFKEQRDKGFIILYMAVNLGALLAPFVAIYAGNYILHKFHFTFDVKLLELSQQYLSGSLKDTVELASLASHHFTGTIVDLKFFCTEYIQTVSLGYSAAFAIAAVSMTLSLIVLVVKRRYFKQYDVKISAKHTEHAAMSANDKERVQTLIILMMVVMFFWMSFYQNGNTLTLFANFYTEHSVSSLSYVFFDLPSVLYIMLIFAAAYIGFTNVSKRWKVYSFIIAFASGAGMWFRYHSFQQTMPIKAEIFQYFNPFFCLLLSPLLILFFEWLHKKHKEPSTPRKIGIGMLITAGAYIIMMVAVKGLDSPRDLHNGLSPVLVSSWWLINVYLMTTVAEVFISPIGMSFVSKVAPAHLKGLMQGAWYGAIALGNLLSGLLGAFLWNELELWQFFFVFVLTSLVSAGFIFAMIHRLEKVSG